MTRKNRRRTIRNLIVFLLLTLWCGALLVREVCHELFYYPYVP